MPPPDASRRSILVAPRQVEGGDAPVAGGDAAPFDLAAGAPLGLKGLDVAVKTMKRGEKAHLVLQPDCE